MKNLKIINRSEWPDWALRVIVPWIVKRAGINWRYQVLIRSTKDNVWGGWGGRYEQRSRVHRRYKPGAPNWIHQHKHANGDYKKYIWPYSKVERRFKTVDFEFPLNSRLDLLVYLLAHEAHHANKGNPFYWENKKTRRVDRKSMEIDCDEEGALAVREFREQWKTYFYPKLYNALLADKEKNRKPTLEEKTHSKRERTVLLLSQWEKKAKFAQNKIKKYKAALKRYENKMAALSEGK